MNKIFNPIRLQCRINQNFTLNQLSKQFKSNNRLFSNANKRYYNNTNKWKIEKREYSNVQNLRKYQQFKSKLSNGNNAIYTLIGLNVAVFVAWQVSSKSRYKFRWMMNNFTVSVNGVFNELKLHTILTSTFSHNDVFHLVANMFTLYFFGTESLAILGLNQFLKLYLGGGILSSLCYITWPFFTPRDWPARYSTSKYAPALGASGAVSGVVLFNILMFPTRMVYIYMILPVPAALFGVAYIGKDLHELYKGSHGIGNAAHLGGAFYGALYYYLRRRF
jgi:membrane associated rhomboid family serine protease